jgi:hypothetical protein
MQGAEDLIICDWDDLGLEISPAWAGHELFILDFPVCVGHPKRFCLVFSVHIFSLRVALARVVYSRSGGSYLLNGP